MQNKKLNLNFDFIQSKIQPFYKTLEGLRNKHLFIFGGTGFMGLWIISLIKFLNQQYDFNIRVTALSRGFSNRDFIDYFYNSSNLKLVKGDVRNYSELPKDVSYILILASNPNLRFTASFPFDSLTTIGEGVSNILKMSEKLEKIEKICFLSSGLVGKDFSDGYVIAKRYAESLCISARQENRLPTFIIRPYTFIGPFQNITSSWAHTMSMSDFINNNPIRILSDGTAKRGYLYGYDAAYWILYYLLNASPGEILSLGSDEEISIKDFARKLYESKNSNNQIIFSDKPHSSSNIDFIPSLEKEKNKYNFKIFTKLAESLKLSIDWYKND